MRPPTQTHADRRILLALERTALCVLPGIVYSMTMITFSLQVGIAVAEARSRDARMFLVALGGACLAVGLAIGVKLLRSLWRTADGTGGAPLRPVMRLAQWLSGFGLQRVVYDLAAAVAFGLMAWLARAAPLVFGGDPTIPSAAFAAVAAWFLLRAADELWTRLWRALAAEPVDLQLQRRLARWADGD